MNSNDDLKLDVEDRNSVFNADAMSKTSENLTDYSETNDFLGVAMPFLRPPEPESEEEIYVDTTPKKSRSVPRPRKSTVSATSTTVKGSAKKGV